jgi:uncharacterized integral membrane protein
VHRLSWIVSVPLALLAISFAVSNLGNISLQLWPLPGVLDLPVFLAVLGALFVGFLIGGTVAWISAGRHRRAARASHKRVQQLERELAEAKAAAATPGPQPTV